jgi:hypothetical protein
MGGAGAHRACDRYAVSIIPPQDPSARHFMITVERRAPIQDGPWTWAVCHDGYSLTITGHWDPDHPNPHSATQRYPPRPRRGVETGEELGAPCRHHRVLRRSMAHAQGQQQRLTTHRQLDDLDQVTDPFAAGVVLESVGMSGRSTGMRRCATTRSVTSPTRPPRRWAPRCSPANQGRRVAGIHRAVAGGEAARPEPIRARRPGRLNQRPGRAGRLHPRRRSPAAGRRTDTPPSSPSPPSRTCNTCRTLRPSCSAPR